MQFIGENRVTVNPQDALRHIMEDKAAEQEPEKPEEKPEEKVKVKEVRLDGDHMEVEL